MKKLLLSLMFLSTAVRASIPETFKDFLGKPEIMERYEKMPAEQREAVDKLLGELQDLLQELSKTTEALVAKHQEGLTLLKNMIGVKSLALTMSLGDMEEEAQKQS